MPALAPTASVPATLRARAVSHSRGGHLVLDDVSVTVDPGTRLGVVGANGAGKSTLLQIMAGLLVPDSGSVDRLPASATVGYLPQDRGGSRTETVADHLRRVTGVGDAEASFEAAVADLARHAPGADDRYAVALERWGRAGTSDFEARLHEVAADLGLGERTLDLPTAALSGGQAARAALAGVLLSRFDVLLLDEPTNDLDFEGLERLEALVAQRSLATVVVSHDREFLERTIDAVLELDEHSHRARYYRGGWRAFLTERAAERQHAETAYAVYEAQRRSLSERANRERRWATTGAAKEKRRPKDHDTAQRDFRVNRTEQLASRARRTQRAVERLEKVEKPWMGWELRFEIEEAPRAGAVVATLEAAVVDRGDFRLGPVDLEVGWGERIWLTGPNGAGKTTLIGALLGHLPLSSGTRRLGPSVVVGELGQARSRWGGGEPLVDAFLRDTGRPAAEGRSLLAKFGIGPEAVARRVDSLSPGERTRAELACFQAVGVNFVVLDEPTNHLDLPALEQLEAALAGYSGTLLVVSHDRRLLQELRLTRQVDLATLAGPDGTRPDG